MPKPSEKEMEREMETVERASGTPGTLPFKEYLKDEERLRQHIERLEKEYDEREKVIERIMEYGTGIESEKALRMYPTHLLAKWEARLGEESSSESKTIAQPSFTVFSYSYFKE